MKAKTKARVLNTVSGDTTMKLGPEKWEITRDSVQKDKNGDEYQARTRVW